jgi:hypothetical protein
MATLALLTLVVERLRRQFRSGATKSRVNTLTKFQVQTRQLNRLPEPAHILLAQACMISKKHTEEPITIIIMAVSLLIKSTRTRTDRRAEYLIPNDEVGLRIFVFTFLISLLSAFSECYEILIVAADKRFNS